MKKKNGELSENNWIVKSNVLNEIRKNKMTISQMRFFSVYLSKINPKDIKSREVTFLLEEYTRVMQFKQTNTTRLIKTAKDLLGLTAVFRNKDGGFKVCQIFKRFELFKGEYNEWSVAVDCHDDIQALMFELKGYYFKYQLWNMLQLTSTNQQRMYEILKQYECAGAREIDVKDLREFLGIEPEEYTRWAHFKVRILDSCQQALADYTDIKFTWEVAGKRGKGGKINKIKFNIEKNDNCKHQTFEEYLDRQEQSEFVDEPEEFVVESKHEYQVQEDKPTLDMTLFADVFNNEFTVPEIELLYKMAVPLIKQDSELKMYDYLDLKYRELNTKKNVKSRYSYLKKLIEIDLNKNDESKGAGDTTNTNITKTRTNRFANFPQRDWDKNQLEQLEQLQFQEAKAKAQK